MCVSLKVCGTMSLKLQISRLIYHLTARHSVWLVKKRWQGMVNLTCCDKMLPPEFHHDCRRWSCWVAVLAA